MIRRPPRSTQSRSSAASDVYKRQNLGRIYRRKIEKISEFYVDNEQPAVFIMPMMVMEMFQRRTFLFLSYHPLCQRGISNKDKEVLSNSYFPMIDDRGWGANDAFFYVALHTLFLSAFPPDNYSCTWLWSNWFSTISYKFFLC